MHLKLVASNPAPAPVEHFDREYLDYREMRDGHHNSHVRKFRDAPRLARIKKACEDVARRSPARIGFRP